jgi:hypothetical protein
VLGTLSTLLGRQGAIRINLQLLKAEVVLLKDDLSLLKETIGTVGEKIDAHRNGLQQDRTRDVRETGPKILAISDLPMLNDIEGDYSPEYIKFARIIRDKITSGELSRSATLLATNLVAEYHVSAQVAYAVLGMLATNRYIARPEGARFYASPGASATLIGRPNHHVSAYGLGCTAAYR